MISISMSQAQYEQALTILEAKFVEDQQKESLEFTDDSKLKGHVHTVQIDADFKYVPEAQTIVFFNEKKHGLYKFVSDDTIGETLKKQLGNIQVTNALSEEATAGNTAAQTLLTPASFVKEKI